MRPLNVLVACEESQAVCLAFRKRGHNAFSCDIQECSGGHPEWHIKGDVRSVLSHDFGNYPEWDTVIAFPPCTDIAVSGARWFKDKQANGSQEKSILFFEFFTMLKTRMVAIENPIGIMSGIYRKPDQIIQPWHFGHGETKATCLWLKNLPKLKHASERTLFEEPTHVAGREARIHRMAPNPDRAKERSKTFPGIARAMAEQWSHDLGNTWNL